MSSRDLILSKLAQHVQLSTGSVAAAMPAKSVGEAAVNAFERFAVLAAVTQMTAVQLAAATGIPAAVSAYLAQAGLPANIAVDPTLAVAAADWNKAAVQVTGADVRPDDDVYVSRGLAAIAECGAIVLATGARRAWRNDFLARTHIVVIERQRLFDKLHEFWSLMRAAQHGGELPREYCLVTGPSRTADLGVPAKLGAHGPARVHVLIVGAI